MGVARRSRAKQEGTFLEEVRTSLASLRYDVQFIIESILDSQQTREGKFSPPPAPPALDQYDKRFMLSIRDSVDRCDKTQVKDSSLPVCVSLGKLLLINGAWESLEVATQAVDFTTSCLEKNRKNCVAPSYPEHDEITEFLRSEGHFNEVEETLDISARIEIAQKAAEFRKDIPLISAPCFPTAMRRDAKPRATDFFGELKHLISRESFRDAFHQELLEMDAQAYFDEMHNILGTGDGSRELASKRTDYEVTVGEQLRASADDIEADLLYGNEVAEQAPASVSDIETSFEDRASEEGFICRVCEATFQEFAERCLQCHRFGTLEIMNSFGSNHFANDERPFVCLDCAKSFEAWQRTCDLCGGAEIHDIREESHSEYSEYSGS